MNREFDFDDIGKRMPYKTPESFFEDNRRRILKHTCGEERRVKNRLHIIIPTGGGTYCITDSCADG